MDFLTFKSFISTEVLILFYYIGAIGLPIGLWFLVTWLINKYQFIKTSYENGQQLIWASLTPKQQKQIIAFFIFCLLFMELFWRMLFEFLIAYMQIRDALV